MEKASCIQDHDRTSIEVGFVNKPCPAPAGVLVAVFIMVLACMEGCGFFVKPQGDVIPVQATAPEFSLPDQKGQQVSLRELLREGPVLVVFYRGHW